MSATHAVEPGRAVQECLIGYAVLFDSRDVDGVTELFTDDAVVDFGDGPVAGRAAVRDRFATLVRDLSSSAHLVTNVSLTRPEREIVDATSLVRALVTDPVGGGTALAMRYEDRLRRGSDARWRICRRVVTVLVSQELAVMQPQDRYDGLDQRSEDR